MSVRRLPPLLLALVLGLLAALAVAGGEDYELLFCIEERLLEQTRAELQTLGTPVTRIGSIVSSGARIGEVELAAWKEMGWEHLRDR